MKRFLLLIFLLQIAFTNRLFAKTFNISQIDQVKLITEYSDDTKIEDIDTVTYGSYYQSNGSNKEAIEWIVLDREEDSALLLSKYILDKQKFDADINNYDKSTWEISSIRKWLNSKFLNNAFNDNEKSYIKPTTVINNDTDYVEYNGSEINNIHTDCGNDTIDKLFLLSVDEVKLYFGEKTDFSVLSNGSYYESDRVYKLITKWTNYAGVAYNSGGSSKAWWLRSMGRSHHHPAKVGGDTFSYAGLNGYYDIAGVRPAMWVTLNNNVSNSELTTNDNTINNQQDERKILGKSINEIGVIDTDQFKSVDEYDLGGLKVEAINSNDSKQKKQDNVTNVNQNSSNSWNANNSVISKNNSDLLNQIRHAKLITEYSAETTVDQMDTISFGSYPQSDVSGNTKDPIEWIVIDKDNNAGRVLLLSKYVLDYQRYKDSQNNSSDDWENSDLRKWLNEYFYNNAFSTDEKNIINNSLVINNNNNITMANGGNNTNDFVFCLSIDELNKYFDYIYSNSDTYYPKLITRTSNLVQKWKKDDYKSYAPGGSLPDNWDEVKEGCFWLRTPGGIPKGASYVYCGTGIVAERSNYNIYNREGVRPAIWISMTNLEGDKTNQTGNNQLKDKTISASGGWIDGLPSREAEWKAAGGGGFYIDGHKQKNKWVYYKTYYYHVDGDGIIQKNQWIELRYVGEDGRMYRGRQTPDGKWVGDDGLAVDTTSNVQTALGDNVSIEGANVYQNLDGSMQIGGTPEEGAKVLDGWVNDTYYRNGIKVVNEWIDRINGSFITKNGEMTWFDNGRYYLGSDGLPEKSKWIGDYYVDDTGKLLTKTITPDGKRVDGTGKLIVDNSDAIIDENFTGLKDGWYYVNGVKQIDTWVKIDGFNYRFDKDGHNYILNPKEDSSNVSESIDDNQQQETNDKNKVYYYAKQDSKNNKMYKTISKKKTKGGLFGTGFFNPFGEGILKKNNKTYYLIEMTLNDETTERLNRYADFSEQHYTFRNAIEWVMLYGNTMNNLNVLMDNYGSISPATKDARYAAPEISDYYQNGKIQLSFEIESERDSVYNKIVNAQVLLIATNNVIKSHDTVFYEEDELGNVSRFEYVEDDGSHVNFVTAYVDCEDRIVEYTSSHVGYQLYVKDGITDYIIHKEYIYEPITKFEKFDIFIMGHDSLSYAIQGNKISHLAEKGVTGMNKFRVYGGRVVEECELNTGKGFEDFEKYYVENKDKW